MRHLDLISGIFWLLIGLLLCIWSSSYKIGTFAEPAPGFYPFGLGVLLILLALILLIQAVKSSSESYKASPYNLFSGWEKVAFVTIALIVCAVLFETIGYLITFFLLVFLSMVGVGERSWRRILLVSVISSLCIYFVFVLLLKQPLPQGFMRV